MAGDLSTAIPLYQASLVGMTLWLGVVKWILDSEESIDIWAVGIITGGTSLLWWALLSFSGSIIQSTSSVPIHRGVTGATSLMLLITGLTVAWVADKIEKPWYIAYPAQLFIGLLVGAITVVLQKILEIVFLSV